MLHYMPNLTHIFRSLSSNYHLPGGSKIGPSRSLLVKCESGRSQAIIVAPVFESRPFDINTNPKGGWSLSCDDRPPLSSKIGPSQFIPQLHFSENESITGSGMIAMMQVIKSRFL